MGVKVEAVLLVNGRTQERETSQILKPGWGIGIGLFTDSLLVNLCTTSQTDNAHVPSMGPHPCDYTGVPMQVIVPTLRPPPFQYRAKQHGKHGYTQRSHCRNITLQRVTRQYDVRQSNTEDCNITL
jgi:hypothetical protein